MAHRRSRTRRLFGVAVVLMVGAALAQSPAGLAEGAAVLTQDRSAQAGASVASGPGRVEKSSSALFCRTVRSSASKLRKLTVHSATEYSSRSRREVRRARAAFKAIAEHAPNRSVALAAKTSRSLLSQLQDVAAQKYGPTSNRVVSRMIGTYLNRAHILKRAFEVHCGRSTHGGQGGHRFAARVGSVPAARGQTFAEQQGSHGVNTFTNYQNASGVGQRVNAWTWVAVSCKVYDSTIASVNPDGYWYRLASSPWYDAYYAPANTFMNGDPAGGPYTHNTDFSVPDCGTSPASPPPPTVNPPGPTAGPTAACPVYTGTGYSPGGLPLYAKLFGHYLKGGGGQVVLDWDYFTRDSAFVTKAKGLKVGDFVSGWSAPVSDKDLLLGLGGFTISHPSASCWIASDSYDFTPSAANLKQVAQFAVYWPLWVYQIGTAQDFPVRASGSL